MRCRLPSLLRLAPRCAPSQRIPPERSAVTTRARTYVRVYGVSSCIPGHRRLVLTDARAKATGQNGIKRGKKPVAAHYRLPRTLDITVRALHTNGVVLFIRSHWSRGGIRLERTTTRHASRVCVQLYRRSYYYTLTCPHVVCTAARGRKTNISLDGFRTAPRFPIRCAPGRLWPLCDLKVRVLRSTGSASHNTTTQL